MMKWWAVISVLLSLLLLLLLTGAGSAESGGFEHEWDATDEAEDDQAPPLALQVLNDGSFEHDTQAATGQTTGIWLILFTSSACEQCEDAELALLLLHSLLEGGLVSPIIAKVNTSESTRTAKRFNVKDAPQLKLFRDRHMFSYKGQWTGASINSFIQEDWKSAPAEDVPKEVGLADEIQEKISALYRAIFEYLGNKPGIMACLGTISAMSGYVVTKQCLIKKRKPKRPRGRPRKHVK